MARFYQVSGSAANRGRPGPDGNAGQPEFAPDPFDGALSGSRVEADHGVEHQREAGDFYGIK